MKQKKHIGLAIFLIIFISVIYIILAAKPLNKEYSFTPVWKISTANPVLKDDSSKTKSFPGFISSVRFFVPESARKYGTFIGCHRLV